MPPKDNLIGKWVTYYGSEADWRNMDFQIIDQGWDSNRIAFYAPNGMKVWRMLGSSFSDPFDKVKPMTTARAEEILNPTAKTVETIDAEIARLEAKIKDLRMARQVIADL